MIENEQDRFLNLAEAAAAKARENLEVKAQGGNFDIASTAAGALVVAVEALVRRERYRRAEVSQQDSHIMSLRQQLEGEREAYTRQVERLERRYAEDIASTQTHYLSAVEGVREAIAVPVIAVAGDRIFAYAEGRWYDLTSESKAVVEMRVVPARGQE